MAEAMGAVGTAASFVQLVDVSLRTCLNLYSFFSSLHNAQNNFQRHIIVLRDVHDAIQLIRQTTASQSMESTEETLLRKHLLGVTHELSSLQKLTAGKSPSKLNVRLKWVIKSAETDRTLQELEHRKTSLILLLQTITLRDSAKCRREQDTNQSILKSLTSLIEQQRQQDIETRSEISSHLHQLSLQLESNVRMYKESLNEGFSTLTRDREVRFPERCFDQALRRALESYILPRVEESFSKRSELQNAIILRLVQEAMGQATEQIISRVADMKGHNGTSGPQSSYIPSDHEQEDQRLLRRFELEKKDNEVTQCGKFQPPKTKEWSYWTSVSGIGTFQIQYGSQPGEHGRFWTIKIDFWPSVAFLLRKCISLRYGNNYDPQGYMALFPSLAIYPIISDQDPIWDIIYKGDTRSLRRRFRDHKNGSHDQNSHGISLLSYAFRSGRLETAEFLLTQGANPTRTTACSRDGLYDLISYTIGHLIRPSTMCLGCHLRYWMDFSLFFSVFHGMVAAGCDLDDCDINVFDCLEDRKFAELELNHSSVSNHGYLSKAVPVNENPYLARIRQMSQFLRRQGLHLTQEPSASRIPGLLKRPLRMTLPVLLECGLDSSYRDPSRDHMASILYHGLYCFQVSNNSFLMDNLISMIRHGADIYDVEWASEDWLDKVADDGVMSATAYAKATNCAPFWRHALKHSGYDPGEVFLEDERRRREFRRLHGASSSSVEIEDTPSYTLRRRIV